GCISDTAFFDITVNPTYDTTVTASICQGASYILPDGSTVSTAGLYPVTLPTVNGCDSLITTDLSIISAFNIIVDTAICDGVTYILPDGSTATTTGSYPVTLTSSGGCDSTITTNLTVNPVYSSVVDTTVCQGVVYILPDGSTATATGSYPVTLASSSG